MILCPAEQSSARLQASLFHFGESCLLSVPFWTTWILGELSLHFLEVGFIGWFLCTNVKSFHYWTAIRVLPVSVKQLLDGKMYFCKLFRWAQHSQYLKVPLRVTQTEDVDKYVTYECGSKSKARFLPIQIESAQVLLDLCIWTPAFPARACTPGGGLFEDL